MSALAEGAVYRNACDTDGDELTLTLLRRITRHGAWQQGVLSIPAPVIGEVWLARLYGSGVEDFSQPEVLCTPEGLASRGFVQVDEATAAVEPLDGER